MDEIAEHGHVLTPGRYVGAEEVEDDDEPFEDKMRGLVGELGEQFAESSRLEAAIKSNLEGLGYGSVRKSASQKSCAIIVDNRGKTCRNSETMA